MVMRLPVTRSVTYAEARAPPPVEIRRRVLVLKAHQLKWASFREIKTMKFLFISRHEPTQRQHDLAAEKGIKIEWHGDADAFSVDHSFVDHHGAYAGVIVVHPAAALRLAPHFYVGVFENANRAPENEKPQFEAAALHVYSLVE
jgi:hypothetical protein